MEPLISVIIPTFNRASIIGSTINSIINQTYQNWECIIIDDLSRDYTYELIQFYAEKDSRIIYFKRPQNWQKGANSCRNYGLDKSSGVYVNWFDSDDIMDREFLDLKYRFITKSNCDFIVSKTMFHDGGAYRNIDYGLTKQKILLGNFILGKQICLTPDLFCKSETLQNIRWNHNLKSGQEFNFVSKYLATGVKGRYLERLLTTANTQYESIHSKQINDEKARIKNKYKCYILTLVDLSKIGCKNQYYETVQNHLLRLSVSYAFQLAVKRIYIPYYVDLAKILFRYNGFKKFLTFNLSLFIAYCNGRGYQLMDKSRN